MSTLFTYSPAPQRTPEWYAARRGKVSASRLKDWLAVSKAKGKEGTPLQARFDYERELQFERQFGASYNNFVTEAMEDGIRLENWVADQYSGLRGLPTEECGCWYSDHFVASPDRLVGDEGLIEIKVVRDATFSDILLNGVPDGHYLQIQGQLWASGRLWCDYTVFNINTKKLIIIRVDRDEELIATLEDSVKAELSVGEFPEDVLFEVSEVPQEIVEFHTAEIGGESW